MHTLIIRLSRNFSEREEVEKLHEDLIITERVKTTLCVGGGGIGE